MDWATGGLLSALSVMMLELMHLDNPPDGSLVSANIGRSDDRGHRHWQIQGEDFLNNTLRPLAPEGILSDWEKLKAVGKKAEQQAKLNGDQAKTKGIRMIMVMGMVMVMEAGIMNCPFTGGQP